MYKLSVSRHYLKKIKNIRAKASNKNDCSSRNISSSDYDSSLSSDSELDEIIYPSGLKYMNKLDKALTDNINNKDQCNDAIEHEPKFDIKFIISSGTNDPLIVVTVSL